MSKKNKPKVELHVECPYCKKAVVVRQFEETITPSVPADKNTWIEVDKDLQKKLPLQKGKK